jgi:hypothetical protein
MSNYIHITNQTLLWNTVNKIPEFQNLSPPKKDLEFKQVIEFFYRKYSHKSILTISELQQINRETIMAFVQQPQQPQQPQQQQQQQQQPQQPQQPQQLQLQQPQLQQQQNISYGKPPLHPQFEERQQIYKQMNAKPDLPSPDIFKMKEEDTAIENMDILIQQYQRQRDIEFQQYTPPPPVINTNTKSVNKKRVRILNDVVDDIDVIDLEIKEKEKKKNVSWSTNPIQIQEYSEDYWEKKIMELEKRCNETDIKIMNLEQIIIKQEVTLSLDAIIQQIK